MCDHPKQTDGRCLTCEQWDEVSLPKLLWRAEVATLALRVMLQQMDRLYWPVKP